MKRRLYTLMVLPAVLLLAACSSSPYSRAIDVRFVPPEARPAIPRSDGLKVAVAPFLDARPDTDHVGTLDPLIGEPEPFIISGVDLGQSVAEAFVDALKRRERWRAWLEHPVIAPMEGGPDVMLSGRVREFYADAQAGLFGTTLEVVVDLAVEVRNREKANPFQVDVQGHVSRRMREANGQKVEELLHEAIQQAVDQFLAATTAEGHMLFKRDSPLREGGDPLPSFQKSSASPNLHAVETVYR